MGGRQSGGDMKIATLIITAALGCALIGPGAAIASPSASQVDPKAVDALAQMSAYLRSIPAFQITLQTQRDDVDVYGQLITLAGGAIYSVRRPNAFAINLNLPSLAARYVYDGKTVTVYDANARVYSSFQAPTTIRATLELAQQKYGVAVPLDDLFTWTEGDSRAKALTAAHYIGKSQVAGQTTSHYAFRQPGIDWQIWIADGPKPTPLRVVIVSSKDAARPQFRADLAWNTAPQFGPGLFTFVPPQNARAVDAPPSR
ncbi:MAG: DUF2092 domain-containing protein [Caulobacterales bacterium]|nr:DUF2092 domain-containing protein [Caulobacterales bacterium]